MNSRKRTSSQVAQQSKHLLRQNGSASNKHFVAAMFQYENGQFAEAETSYRQILANDPNHADSWHMLGLALAKKEQYEEAIQSITNAIARRPRFILYYANRAALYQQLGRYAEAVADYHQSVFLGSRDPAVWNQLGNTLYALKKPSDAIKAYDQSIKLDPSQFYVYHMLGNIYLTHESYEQALVCFEEVLRLQPDCVEAIVNVASALKGLKRNREAIDCYERALALQPENAHVHFNMGVAWMEFGQHAVAEKYYQQAIAIDPKFIEPYINLANFYQNESKFDLASDYFKKARAIDPENANLLFNEAFYFLKQGDFDQGWKKYEARLNVLIEHQQQIKPSQPRWQGESFVGKTLLVRVEQGFGDTLQFIRYIPLVKERGGRVIVACHKQLLSLLKSCYKTVVDMWIPSDGTPPIFDYYIDLMSLPLIFETRPDTIPFAEGYLKPVLNSDVTMLEQNTSNKKIGLVWAGSSGYKNDVTRSMPLSEYVPILDMPGFTFYSLQWGEKGREDIANENLDGKLIDLSSKHSNFLDTTALVKQLDLVITVDTSTAHLAGAMAKKTWILLSALSDFRWFHERKDSPWYHSVKLFRQPTLGDWDSVIQSVAADLVKV